MSPTALVEKLIELQIDWFAITDHNSMANCPAYEYAAQRANLAFTWGVEIQSAEEIHLLAYFDSPAQAQGFDAELYSSLLPLDNDTPSILGSSYHDENETF
jgi:predicted metal-dependent phosphoesterase TrpH